MGKKIQLKDVTFVVPLRIESAYRKLNLDTLISLLCRDFDSNIMVLEADLNPLYISSEHDKTITYHFVKDEDPIFHRTKYINKLLESANTKFVGVWDTDAILYPQQIEDSVNILRKGSSTMVLPYNSLSNLFRKTRDYLLLQNIEKALPLMYGYHSVGGAFFINRQNYIDSGGENEKIYGWGPEDVERVKRMETLNSPVDRVQGSLFHLWHPRDKNSIPANKTIKKNNIKELVRVCSI